MKAVIERRESRAARWSGRLATFTTVLLLVAGLSHRFGILETVPFLGVLLIAGLLAAIGLGFAFAGFADLWERGERGGRRALAAMIVCCVLLAPYALSAWRVLEHPRLADVATDLDDPPVFRSLATRRPAFSNTLAGIDASRAQAIRTGYPDLLGRRYPVSPDRVSEQVLALIAERGWRVAAMHGLADAPPPAAGDEPVEAPPPAPDPGPAAAEADPPPVPGDAAAAPEGGGAGGEMSIEVRAFSPWLRFPADVVVRLTDEGESTFVDMRSASHFGQHDLGDNADRIRGFLADLDARMETGGDD
jgi:hypothetical protein